jgi:hypothetical protein
MVPLASATHAGLRGRPPLAFTAKRRSDKRRILAGDDPSGWAVISPPAFAEAGDQLGRSEGEALSPERYDEPALEQIRTAMSSSFQALYQ